MVSQVEVGESRPITDGAVSFSINTVKSQWSPPRDIFFSAKTYDGTYHKYDLFPAERSVIPHDILQEEVEAFEELIFNHGYFLDNDDLDLRYGPSHSFGRIFSIEWWNKSNFLDDREQ